MTAHDVLTVLNDLEPVDLDSLTFAVIIGSMPPERGTWPFELGEIVVLNRDGREPFGEKRKPGKWDVEYEDDIATLGEALAIRASVLEPVSGGADRNTSHEH